MTAIQFIPGECPACHRENALFVTEDDAGEYVTCSNAECPDPCLADHMAIVLGTGPAANWAQNGREAQ